MTKATYKRKPLTELTTELTVSESLMLEQRTAAGMASG